MNASQWKAWAQHGAEPHLNQLLADVPGLSGALLASSDGFEIAAATHAPDLPLARLAAMASAMHGLGEAMTRETGLKNARDIIVDSDHGKVALMSIPGDATPQLVLMAVANDQPAFGQLLLQCRKCVVAISHQLGSRSDHPAAVQP